MSKLTTQSLLLQTLAFLLCLFGFMPTHALAWDQHALPSSYIDSSTVHYGGNKAPLVLSTSHIQVATPQVSGITHWQSINDGISWTPSSISNNPNFTQVFLATPSLALGWGETQVPTMFHPSVSPEGWSAVSTAWPLANWNIIDVSTSITGDIIVLVTTPTQDKLVEGDLFILFGNDQGWSSPILLSVPSSLVGDAAIVTHTSGLQSIIWSQRSNNDWQILARHSADSTTWSQSQTIVAHIAAPYFQEAAVQIAADTLNQDEIALAFTGWSMQAHSQIWSKAFDAASGTTTQPLSLLPDTGDMVYQPSLVSLSTNTWAVAWQQTMGIDSEILIAQHHADGTWSDAVNVSVDSMHMDRDPHISQGSSKTLSVAYTRRIQADIQEVYMFSEGDIQDESLDIDGDGIANSQEQGFDLDNDGIDDSLSARVATWQAEDGRYALIVKGNGELQHVQAPSLLNINVATPYDYDVGNHLFSFQIHALNPGETTQVHIITPNTLDENTTWLKFDSNAAWSDSEKHNVQHDPSGTGLIISLTDGGTGDEDGVSNGIIVDPAALATPKVQTETSAYITSGENAPTSQAAGCLMPSAQQASWSWILGLFLIVGIFTQRQRSNV